MIWEMLPQGLTWFKIGWLVEFCHESEVLLHATFSFGSPIIVVFYPCLLCTLLTRGGGRAGRDSGHGPGGAQTS